MPLSACFSFNQLKTLSGIETDSAAHLNGTTRASTNSKPFQGLNRFCADLESDARGL